MSDLSALLDAYARRRDPADLDELVRRFGPLARRLALRYARPGEPIDDLEQVANIGLIKALNGFDPARGFAFSSYAVPTITGELKRWFRSTSWATHVPRAVQESAARVRAARDRLEATHGRPATVAELAADLGTDEEEVLEALDALSNFDAASLDAPIDADDGEMTTLGAQIAHTDDGYERVEDRAAIQGAAATLTSAQRTALALRFDDDLRQSEIATRMGVSQMQVSRLLRAGVDRLRIVALSHSEPGRPEQNGASRPG